MDRSRTTIAATLIIEECTFHAGRNHDFKDAERLVRRLIANELILSFVPDGEQRTWRNLTRMKTQLRRERRVRLQNQMECLLEENADQAIDGGQRFAGS